MSRPISLSLSLSLSLSACGTATTTALPDTGPPTDAAVVVDAAPPIDAAPPVDAGPPAIAPRVVLVGHDGRVVVTDVTSPWATRGTVDLARASGSTRCRAGRCVVVHPAPDGALSVIRAEDASFLRSVTLPSGADPRDVALVDDHTAVVTLHDRAALLVVELDGTTQTPIDLSALGSANPELGHLAFCGRRLFVQSTTPPALAVVDLDAPAPLAGTVALAVAPAFDMPVDCDAGLLQVAEPRPILSGGSRAEEVDLDTLVAHDLGIADTAEIGGFVLLPDGRAWQITHTEFGPGASSHVNLQGASGMSTYNTFAEAHVDDLALDLETDLLFFPDPCSPERYSGCEPGLAPFVASTGERASARSIDVGIAPFEVVVAR